MKRQLIRRIHSCEQDEIKVSVVGAIQITELRVAAAARE